MQPYVYTPRKNFPTLQIIMLFQKSANWVGFLDFMKKHSWTQELLKRLYADLTLSKLSTLKSVKELINHLSLLVREPKVELHGSAGLTSKTRSWFANFTNTTLETFTSTTSVMVHKWSTVTSKDNLHSRLSFFSCPTDTQLASLAGLIYLINGTRLDTQQSIHTVMNEVLPVYTMCLYKLDMVINRKSYIYIYKFILYYTSHSVLSIYISYLFLYMSTVRIFLVEY